MKRLLVALALLSISLPVISGQPSVGAAMADLMIEDRGEMMLNDDEVSYQPWVYPQQPGKVHIVQYMAATMSASKINEPFTDRMKTDLEPGGFYSTTILNLDEALWGTTGFVVSEVKSNKRQFPDAILVLDGEGTGLKTWQLDKKSSAVIVVDANGVVRYIKQGAMSETEVEQTLELVRTAIAESS